MRDQSRNVFEIAAHTDSVSMCNDLELLVPDLKVAERGANHTIDGVVIGTLVDVTTSGRPMVDYPTNPLAGPLQAHSTVALDKGHLGRNVLLTFIDRHPQKPVVMGLLEEFKEVSSKHLGKNVEAKGKSVRAEIDGERITLSAEKEIVLRCGEASITLTRAGKIIIRGAYLVSRSTGVNRIKGGVVHIN